MNRIFYILLFFCLTIGEDFFAQKQEKSNLKHEIESSGIICEATIENAKTIFEEGNYEECISLLNSALQTCDFKKKKKEKILEMIINANLERDNLASADSGFQKLLLNNPDYSIEDYSGIDEFPRLLKQYYIYPTSSINLFIQPTFQKVISSKIYKVRNQVDYNSNFNSPILLNYALRFEKSLSEHFALHLESGFNKTTYEREIRDESWAIKIRENNQYAQLNLGTKRLFNTDKKWNFYLGIYVGGQYLLNNSISILQEEQKLNNPFGYELSSIRSEIQSYDFSNARSYFIYFTGLQAGVSRRIGNWSFSLEASSNFSLNTINDKARRFQDDKLIENFSYIDNDMKMTNTSLNLGIGRYFDYKVKKYKK